MRSFYPTRMLSTLVNRRRLFKEPSFQDGFKKKGMMVAAPLASVFVRLFASNIHFIGFNDFPRPA